MARTPVVGRLWSEKRVSASFQISPRPVGRLGLGFGFGTGPGPRRESVTECPGRGNVRVAKCPLP